MSERDMRNALLLINGFAHEPPNHVLGVLLLYMEWAVKLQEAGAAENKIARFAVKVTFDDARLRL
jgi:hypothetical protein